MSVIPKLDSAMSVLFISVRKANTDCMFCMLNNRSSNSLDAGFVILKFSNLASSEFFNIYTYILFHTQKYCKNTAQVTT